MKDKSQLDQWFSYLLVLLVTDNQSYRLHSFAELCNWRRYRFATLFIWNSKVYPKLTILKWNSLSDSEVISSERLTKLPIGRDNVPRRSGATVTGFDTEWEWLSDQDGVWLPVLPPVTAHAHPPSLGPFDAHLHNIPCTRDVGDQNQVEVGVAIDLEPDPSSLLAWHPTWTRKAFKSFCQTI